MDDKASSDYCLISKTLIEDRLVSLKAKGMYAVLCCWPKGYDCSIRNLTDELGIGKESASRLLKELTDLGYIEKNGVTEYRIFPKSSYD